MADDSTLGPGTIHESTGQDQPEKARTPEQLEDEALIQEIRENFAFVRQVEDVQRRQEEDDLYFEGETQWDEAALSARSEHIDEETGQKVPARPHLDINLVDQPVQRVIDEARKARLAITVGPKAGIKNTKQTGYFKGLIRSIQVESGAAEGRLWALERTAK